MIIPGGLYSGQQGYDIATYISGTLTIGGMAVSSVVVEPGTATLYAGIDGSGIYTSPDRGTSWTPAATQPENSRVKELVRKNSDTIFAATSGSGVFISSNSGVDWAKCPNNNLTNLNVLSLTIDGGGSLYAGTESGVFVSTNDCSTWTALNTGLPN